MLHTETVSPELLDLIRKLCNEPLLKDFYLVGGTALSLQMGHRISTDIDLFTPNPFDAQTYASQLADRYQITRANIFPNTIMA